MSKTILSNNFYIIYLFFFALYVHFFLWMHLMLFHTSLYYILDKFCFIYLSVLRNKCSLGDFYSYFIFIFIQYNCHKMLLCTFYYRLFLENIRIYSCVVCTINTLLLWITTLLIHIKYCYNYTIDKLYSYYNILYHEQDNELKYFK